MARLMHRLGDSLVAYMDFEQRVHWDDLVSAWKNAVEHFEARGETERVERLACLRGLFDIMAPEEGEDGD